MADRSPHPPLELGILAFEPAHRILYLLEEAGEAAIDVARVLDQVALTLLAGDHLLRLADAAQPPGQEQAGKEGEDRQGGGRDGDDTGGVRIHDGAD